MTAVISRRMIPCVEPVIDQRVDHGVGHGEPIESQIDVLDVAIAGDSLVVEDPDKVQVVGQPRQCEHGNHDDEHTDHLQSST